MPSFLPLVVWICLWGSGAAEQVPQVITDIEGRSLSAIVLEVADGAVMLKRQKDGKQFTIPLENLSAATRESLAGFEKPDVPATDSKPIIEPSITPEMLAQFQLQLEQIRSEIAASTDRRLRPLDHHMLLEGLERKLVVAASPKDPAVPIDWPPQVSSATQRKVEKLRQEIRDGERELVLAELDVEKKRAKAKPPARGGREELEGLFARSTKSLNHDIKQATKALARERQAAIPREGVLSEQREKIRTADASLASVHRGFHGYEPGKGMNVEPGWPSDHPAELLRKEIHGMRSEILKKLREASQHKGEGDYRLAEIDGVEIYSSSFGVILDISGSMHAHIEPLKQEIAKGFRSPLYCEVQGCSLILMPAGNMGNFPSTLSCIEEMILVHQVDTIYWFCDLRDTRTPEALHRLRDLLRMSGVKFYVRSVGKEPDAELKALIHDF